MSDAEAAFAERLAHDLERVLGAGIAIDDIELHADDGRATAHAVLLIEGRVVAERRVLADGRSRVTTKGAAMGRTGPIADDRIDDVVEAAEIPPPLEDI